MSEYEAISTKRLDRIASFLRNAMLVHHADAVAVLAVVSYHEDEIARLVIPATAEPDAFAREQVAPVIAEHEDTEVSGFRLRAFLRADDVSSLLLPVKGKGRAGKGDKAEPMPYRGNRDDLINHLLRRDIELTKMLTEGLERRDAAQRQELDAYRTHTRALEQERLADAARYLEVLRKEAEVKSEIRMQEAQSKALEATATVLTDKLMPAFVSQAQEYIASKMGSHPLAKALAPAVNVLESLTPEQVVGLQALLKPDQFAALVKAARDVEELKKRAGGAEPPPKNGKAS